MGLRRRLGNQERFCGQQRREQWFRLDRLPISQHFAMKMRPDTQAGVALIPDDPPILDAIACYHREPGHMRVGNIHATGMAIRT